MTSSRQQKNAPASADTNPPFPSIDKTSKRGFILAALGVVCAAVALAFAFAIGGAPRDAAARPARQESCPLEEYIAFDPTSQSVRSGTEFTWTIYQSSADITAGVSMEILFDHRLLEIVQIQRGSPYNDPAATFLVGTVIDSVPQTVEEAIAEANTTGVLHSVAAYFAPGSGKTLEPGRYDALTLTVRARPNLYGIARLQFKPGIDFTGLYGPDGELVEVPLKNGLVEVTGDPGTMTQIPTYTPTASSTPTETPTGTLTPIADTETPSPTPTACVTATATGTNTLSPTVTETKVPATMKYDPSSWTTGPNGEFAIKVIQNAPVITTGAQIDIQFDQEKLTLLKLEKGSAYENAGPLTWTKRELPLPTGTPTATPVTPEYALQEANESTGLLEQVSVYFSGTAGELDPGEHEAFVLTFRASQDASGTSSLKMLNPELQRQGSGSGDAILVTTSDAEIKIEGAEATITPTPSPTVVGTPTVAGTATVAGSPTVFSTVAGTGQLPASSGGTSATGLPNAGAWFGEDGTRSLILGISAITLLVSLIALANTWIRRRGV